MRIISKPDFMIATDFPNRDWHMWNKGSHIVNVWREDNEFDVYSFAWEKNRTSMLDFTTALESYTANEI